MNAREIEAKARLLYDEYGPDALERAARRAEAFGARADAPSNARVDAQADAQATAQACAEADDWRAVEKRVAALVRRDIAAETAQIETEIRRAGGRTRLARLLGRLFGAGKTA